jgi:GABA(A) receptor-associated protein
MNDQDREQNTGKNQQSLEDRKRESQKILIKYPERVPVICRKGEASSLINIKKQKFLVPGTMMIGEFKYVIFKAIKNEMDKLHEANKLTNASSQSEKTIYLFTDSREMPKTGKQISELYNEEKNEDGFLYLYYTEENTMG